jgi:hypothetical protein
MYVYIQSEPQLWTVGFYAPDGSWNPDSDHSSKDKAKECARYLNQEIAFERIKTLEHRLDELEAYIK